ncbi:hypothetical protein KR222_001209 [Zaprionus bogoriensis]|nr:hypothetical protein KR222_001209 [Zaprionus bogoriensis]
MLKNMQKESIYPLRCMATYQSRYGYPILGTIKSYYDVLKVPANCSGSEIKRAYIELSKKYHPDGNSSTSDPEEFVKVCEAYKVLYKRVSRSNYDSRLRTQFYMVPPYDMSYTKQNVHRTWKKYQSEMRNKQFGHNISSSFNSSIMYKKPYLAIESSCAHPVRMAAVEAESIDSFDTNTFSEKDWKVIFYLTGFIAVGVLLAIDNFNKRKHNPKFTQLCKNSRCDKLS